VPEPVVEIPNRPAFRASEVCEIAQIPAYVLKSWEKEFPGLGVVAKPGGPRVYRRSDVEQVVRIKHMLFAEGLTLAGARRRFEGEPKAEDEPLPDLTVPGEVREKVSRVKQELRSLLDLLSTPAPPWGDGTRRGVTHPEVVPGAPPDAGELPAEPAEATPVHEADLPFADGAADAANPPCARKGRRPRKAAAADPS
jgi:DNA-binding transcriptional MerR regulator